MGKVRESVASLRVMGDSLSPSRVTELLGCVPTRAAQKGEVIQHRSGSSVATTGIWSLKAKKCEPENLDQQISWILGQLTTDLEIWADLGKEFKIDLFCGLFMGNDNEGFLISPSTMLAIGSRGIEIGFDIYALG